MLTTIMFWKNTTAARCELVNLWSRGKQITLRPTYNTDQRNETLLNTESKMDKLSDEPDPTISL